MAEELPKAREAIRRASDETDNAAVREQLRSLDEGLMEMTESSSDTSEAKTEGDEPHPHPLTEVEEKLVGLANRTDGPATEHIEEARDLLDAYRRREAPDW